MEPNAALSIAGQYFNEQRLSLPFIPESQKDNIKCLDPGVFGSKEFDKSPYDLPYFLKMALSEKVSQYVLFGFAGHGISSHAMHYFAVSDHLALFFQKGFGNIQRDRDDERFKVNGVFESARLFFQFMNEAVKNGKVPEGRRLFVVISDFHPDGCGWGWIDGTPGKVNERWESTDDFLKALGAIPLP